MTVHAHPSSNSGAATAAAAASSGHSQADQPTAVETSLQAAPVVSATKRRHSRADQAAAEEAIIEAKSGPAVSAMKQRHRSANEPTAVEAASGADMLTNAVAEPAGKRRHAPAAAKAANASNSKLAGSKRRTTMTEGTPSDQQEASQFGRPAPAKRQHVETAPSAPVVTAAGQASKEAETAGTFDCC